MDKTLRNVIYNMVVQCRRLLEQEMAQQLEGTFGIRADGKMDPPEELRHLDAMGRADRLAIEATIEHELALGVSQRQAVEHYIRESAFTWLNRLAALKVMEQPGRGLIQPSVGQADLSRGFSQFRQLSPEAMHARADGGYRLYLELLCDDLAQGLGPLFDRSLPTSILFPSATCLQEVLALLNQPALQDIWVEDETLGWIYQYFTPTELRNEVRKASGAPRNSYELAFRNQFYTPRYVVEFLVDNTLGRLWWEMSGGRTRLGERCRYLLRRPEAAFVQRPMRDPRELRILDPACGSGHFLLYAYELLTTIYEEAYADPAPPFHETHHTLAEDYPEPEGFRRDIPRLILQHNLHGIDIDLRACQIATLVLWLRAQRAYGEQELCIRERPAIEQVHVVCAEPMPGEFDLLGEFVRDLKPAVLGNMLRDVWERMQLAGEAGSLLKVEQEIRDSIRRARETVASLPPTMQLTMFGPPAAQQRRLDPAEIQDEAFWDQAEARVLEALRSYAQRAGNGGGTSRRLFAQDAAQGMAFVDLLQQPFDVVLMNPPFGAASTGSKEYIAQAYPRTKNDLYAAFVERGLELLRPGGYLGAITSRTGFFLSSFQRWREEILLREAQLITLADLGYGVLDTAMVETAAYVLRKGGPTDG